MIIFYSGGDNGVSGGPEYLLMKWGKVRARIMLSYHGLAPDSIRPKYRKRFRLVIRERERKQGR